MNDLEEAYVARKHEDWKLTQTMVKPKGLAK